MCREVGYDGGGQRMLGFHFGGADHVPVFGQIGSRRDPVDYRRASFGQRAGFVHNDGVDTAQLFEGGRIFDQDLVFGSLADADHQCGRRSQSQCAGTGDDQHRDGRQQRIRKVSRTADSQPQHEGQQCDADDRRHENRGDPVGDALHGGFAALGLLYHADDPGQQRVAACSGSFQDECSARIDRAGYHFVPCLFADGQRLAGDHAFVDERRSFPDDAVHRDFFTGTD